MQFAKVDRRANGVGAEPFEDEFHTIFDGNSNSGWMLCDKRAPSTISYPERWLQPTRHGQLSGRLSRKSSPTSSSILITSSTRAVTPASFFASAILTDPVRTGIEVALDDTTGHGFGDSGAIYGLVAPEVNAQKPAGQWNHMTITAQGPEITVVLNGSPVSSINLDEWTIPGKRPDGSHHNFKNIAVANLARTGYVGFQDLKGNCWFNQIRLRKLSPGGVSSPKSISTTRSPRALSPLAEGGSGVVVAHQARN